MPLPRRQVLKIRLFRGTQDLDPFFCEIRVESGKSQAWAVDGWLPNPASEADPSTFQLKLESLGVTLEKSLHGHHRHVHALAAGGADGYGWLLAHLQATCIPNRS